MGNRIQSHSVAAPSDCYRAGGRRDWLTFLAVIAAPLAGTVVFFVGSDLMYGSGPGADQVVLGWIFAGIVTAVIGFPLGFGVSFLLRAMESESLLAYTLGAIAVAGAISAMFGDIPLALGILTTAVILAFAYWFGIAKPRIALANA